MGTRGLYGFIIRGSGCGLYNHYDSYHTGLGARLVFLLLLLTDAELHRMAVNLNKIVWVDSDDAASVEETARLHALGLVRPGTWRSRFHVADDDREDKWQETWYNAVFNGQFARILPYILAGQIHTLPDYGGFEEDSLFCEYTYWLDFDRQVLSYEGVPDDESEREEARRNGRPGIFGIDWSGSRRLGEVSFADLRAPRRGAGLAWYLLALTDRLNMERDSIARNVWERNMDLQEKAEAMILKLLEDTPSAAPSIVAVDEDRNPADAANSVECGTDVIEQSAGAVGTERGAMSASHHGASAAGVIESDAGSPLPAGSERNDTACIDAAERSKKTQDGSGGKTIRIAFAPPLPALSDEDKDDLRYRNPVDIEYRSKLIRLPIHKVQVSPHYDPAELPDGWMQLDVPEEFETMWQALGMAESEMRRDWACLRLMRMLSAHISDEVRVYPAVKAIEARESGAGEIQDEGKEKEKQRGNQTGDGVQGQIEAQGPALVDEATQTPSPPAFENGSGPGDNSAAVDMRGDSAPEPVLGKRVREADASVDGDAQSELESDELKFPCANWRQRLGLTPDEIHHVRADAGLAPVKISDTMFDVYATDGERWRALAALLACDVPAEHEHELSLGNAGEAVRVGATRGEWLKLLSQRPDYAQQLRCNLNAAFKNKGHRKTDLHPGS